jgi:hypothetical protein
MKKRIRRDYDRIFNVIGLSRSIYCYTGGPVPTLRRKYGKLTNLSKLSAKAQRGRPCG